MNYIDNNFLTMTRTFLIKKAKYHNDQYDILKDTKDIYLGNGKYQSDIHFIAVYEYMLLYGDVCEVLCNMLKVDNSRKYLSSKLGK